MFAGIVEEAAQVLSLETSQKPYRLRIASTLNHSDTEVGDSICIDGVCLTVVELKQTQQQWELAFDLAAETVRRTCLGTLTRESIVNLERSLKVGNRVHGHFVFGHVDGLAQLISRTNDGNCDRLEWQVSSELMPFIAEKGSISLSGISLTVGEVTKKTFCVYIIPHTSEVTSVSRKSVGDSVNVEVDMLARYVAKQLSWKAEGGSGVNSEFLKQHGFIA